MSLDGLFGKLQAQAGKRLELAEILMEAADMMDAAAGCVLYVVNRAADDSTAVWGMVVWESEPITTTR